MGRVYAALALIQIVGGARLLVPSTTNRAANGAMEQMFDLRQNLALPAQVFDTGSDGKCRAEENVEIRLTACPPTSGH